MSSGPPTRASRLLVRATVNEPEVLLAATDIAPYGVTFEGGVLYWSDYVAGTIRRLRP